MNWYVALFGFGFSLMFTTGKVEGASVAFDKAGTVLVDGKPFFPIGIFLYALDRPIMAGIKKEHFNTVSLLTENHDPGQLDWLQREALMGICPPKEKWIEAGTNHPALLAWYLSDEPEGHGHSPADLHQEYISLKARDPQHPVALDHFMWDAIINYRDDCDFTMTSVYPLLANGPQPITQVGLFIDHARAVHKDANWPHLPFVQLFGGKDCEGGKWKQPDPGEVRCMVYNALVHRANGIFYFSYWPKATNTWEAVGALNREMEKMTPWLVAPGTELETKSNLPEVQVRAKSVDGGNSGVVLLINTTPVEHYAEISIPQLPTTELTGRFDGHKFQPVNNTFNEKLKPYDSRCYVWGKEPRTGQIPSKD